jgi:ammonia channel protein AmtB
MASKPGPPIGELAVILIALVLLVVVFIIWWLFGYQYAFEEPARMAFNTVASTTSTTLLTL